MRCELSFYFDTILDFSDYVSEHDFLLRCIPPDTPEQKILSYTLSVFPEGVITSSSRDAFGNRVCAGRIAGRHKRFRYTLQGVAYRDDSLKIREDIPPFYCYPSPFTHPTRELEDFFRSVSPAGSAADVAKKLADEVHGLFRYSPGRTDVSTTAGEAFRRAEGVCQDYAHVLITLCRMAKIPARYVSGLPIGEGASHAWVEIWADGSWIGLDPTRNCMVNEGYLKLCVGRDYGDCPIERGIFSGCADQTQTVFMKVTDER